MLGVVSLNMILLWNITALFLAYLLHVQCLLFAAVISMEVSVNPPREMSLHQADHTNKSTNQLGYPSFLGRSKG